jgi:branched-chain amino acid transport system substrate-binding protein
MHRRCNLPGLSVRLLVFALLIAAFFSAACAPAMQPESQAEQDATAFLDRAEAQLAKKQYEAATKSVEAMLQQFPSSRHRDRALFLAGGVRFELRDFGKARPFFQNLLRDYADSAFAPGARYRLGVCAFELKDYESAITNLEAVKASTDPEQTRKTAEMLSSAYLATKRFPAAVRQFVALADAAQIDQQKTAYRDRVRQIVENDFDEKELRSLASGFIYPSDIAQLRLAGQLLDRKKYTDAQSVLRDFIEKFPNHPEKTRAEMLLNEATTRLSTPRYTIGALLPLSGQLAFFGDRVRKGAQLAVYLYNQKNPDSRVELLLRDTEGSPEKAVTALQALASDKIVAVIGPLMTREAESVAPLLGKLSIAAITPAATGEIKTPSPWLFRNAMTNAAQSAAAAQFAINQHAQRIVIMHPDDFSGKDLSRGFVQALDKKADVLATVAYPPETKDFGPYIRRVLEIDLRSRKIPIPEDDAERKKLFQDYTPGFDALYLPGSAERVGLLLPQLAFYDISSLTVIGSSGWHNRDLIERGQKYADNAVFPDGFFPETDDAAMKAVFDAYRSAYQEDPDVFAAQAYDAAAYVLALLSGGKDSPQAIRDGLAGLANFPGLSGTISFDGKGESQKKLFLITIKNNAFTLYSDK